jgi:hypothetical protein
VLEVRIVSGFSVQLLKLAMFLVDLFRLVEELVKQSMYKPMTCVVWYVHVVVPGE